jgi:arsenite methyltransferase
VAEMSADRQAVRDVVRDRYAAAARTASEKQGDAGSCCPDPSSGQEDVFGRGLYQDEDVRSVPESALDISLGCGNPAAVADVAPGETVLDLGSGGGIDLLLTARRVGPAGKVYGLDMTDEMLDLARANVEQVGARNVELLKGFIEDVPLPDDSVDLVISNCVINLSGDKRRVFEEAARVLRPGGRFAVSDVVADEGMDERTRVDMQAWTGCIAGALTRAEFIDGLQAAGFRDVEIRETHRVHKAAMSAIIRARKPVLADCCDREACCRTSEKEACCGDPSESGSCGCQ